MNKDKSSATIAPIVDHNSFDHDDIDANFQTLRRDYKDSKAFNLESIDENFVQEEEEEERDHLDFGVPEISELLKLLTLDLGNKALILIKKTQIFEQIPLYRLFGIYLAIWYQNEQIYNHFLAMNTSQDQLTTDLDKRAWALVKKHSFKQFCLNEDDSRDKLTEIVQYRALDFNIKDIFSHSISKNSTIKLRKSDALTLLKYKHYEQIRQTFSKNIKKGIMGIFFEQNARLTEEQFYQNYSLAFYLELMINEGYTEQQILDTIRVFRNDFSVDSAIQVFIRQEKLNLVKWAEEQPDYVFRIEYLGQCIHYESFEIFVFFGNKYQDFILKNQSYLPFFTIQSFKASNSYLFQKLLMVRQFFKAFSVRHLESILNIMEQSQNSGKIIDCQFLYVRNPISLGLFGILTLRQISTKYKSLEVKCMQIEQYIEESILKFLDIMNNDEINQEFFLETFTEGISPLYLLAKLKLYRIIQHRNTQEVINNIYRSEYSIESNVCEIFSVYNIVLNEDIFAGLDYEQHCRFYRFKWDRKNASQNSLMFHIWKKSSYIRFLLEFYSITFLVLTLALCVIGLMTTFIDVSLGYSMIVGIYSTTDLTNIDPVTYSLVAHGCSTFKERLPLIHMFIYGSEIVQFIQVGFFAKLFNDRFFIHKTKRIHNGLTAINVLQFLLGCCGLYQVLYKIFLANPPDGSSELCRLVAGYDEKDIRQYDFTTPNFSGGTYVNIMYTTNIALLWLFILVQMRLFQKLGTLIKIISRMFQDFMKILVLFAFIILVFMMAGFFLFQFMEEFNSYVSILQTLINISLGNFNFGIFDRGEAEKVQAYSAPTAGKFYTILLIILMNIMCLNLMIAVFSDTYNKLQLIAEGIFLTDIIEMSPEKQYDEYYSGLISGAFPFSMILWPFQLFYLCFKSKGYNDCILYLCHFNVVSFMIVPGILIVSPIFIVLAYFQSLVTKISLISKKQEKADRLRKLADLVLFFFFGIVILAINTLFEIPKLYYILQKPEEELQLRGVKDTSSIDEICLERMLTMFDSRWINAGTKKKPTKGIINELQKGLKVEHLISQLVVGDGNKEQILDQLKSFTRLKQLFIDNSIEEHGIHYIYPQMISAIFNDIKLIRSVFRMKGITQQRKKKKIRSHSQNQVRILEEQEEKKDLLKHLQKKFLKAQVGKAAKAFVVKKVSVQEEAERKIEDRLVDRIIKDLDLHSEETKSWIVNRAANLKK